MTTGFGETFLGRFSKNKMAGFSKDDGGFTNLSSRSTGSRKGMFPEDISGFHIHAVELGVVALIAKAPHEVIIHEEGILENHGEVTVAMNDLGLEFGDIDHGIAHVVSGREMKEAPQNGGI